MSTSDFHSVVSEFFTEQGWSTSAVLIKTTSVYDDATSENIVTETRYNMRAMPFDYIRKEQGDGTAGQTLVRSGDKQVFLAPSQYITDIDPSADKLQLGTKIFRIVTVKEFNPTMTDVLYYELYVRN
jgi:hypothetical protein